MKLLKREKKELNVSILELDMFYHTCLCANIRTRYVLPFLFVCVCRGEGVRAVLNVCQLHVREKESCQSV